MRHPIQSLERMMDDPTWTMDEIRADPIWHAAWIMSEHLNDASPMGWGFYIPVAKSLVDAGLLAPAHEDRTGGDDG